MICELHDLNNVSEYEGSEKETKIVHMCACKCANSMVLLDKCMCGGYVVV